MKYTKRQLKNKFKSSYWLNLYASIRSLESRKELKQLRYRNASEDKVLLAINNIYKPLITLPVPSNQVRVINDQLSNIPKFQLSKQQTITPTEGPPRFVYGASDFIGTSYLSLTGGLLTYLDQGAATFEGSGVLSAEGGKFTFLDDGAATFEGSGTLTATGGKFVYVSGDASFEGSGTLTATGEKFTYEDSAVSFDGAGTMGAAGTQISTAAATFTGTATMSADGVPISIASVTFTGSGDMTVAAEAVTNLPSFLSHGWEADFGINTGSTDHVIAWEAVTGSEWADLNQEGAAYVSDYSGSGTPVLIFTASDPGFTVSLSSSLSGGFTITSVFEVISSSIGNGNVVGLYAIGGDHGYGSSHKGGIGWKRDTNQIVHAVKGRYTSEAQDSNGPGNRELHGENGFNIKTVISHFEMSADSTTTVDHYHKVSGSSEVLVINDYDPDAYDRWDNTDWDTIYFGSTLAGMDEFPNCAVKAFYVTTGSLTSDERTELYNYIDGKWWTTYDTVVNNVGDIFARYKLDESSGIIADSGPNNITGTATGTPEYSTAMTYPKDGGSGIGLNGTGEYFTLGDKTDWNYMHQTATFSIASWFKWGKPTNELDILMGNCTSGNHEGFAIWFDNRVGQEDITLILGGNGASTIAEADVSNINADEETFLVVTCGTGSNEMKIYVNGEDVTVTPGTAVAKTGDSEFDILLGSDGSGATSWEFSGVISDVAVFDKILTDQQIRNLWEAGSGSF